MAKLDLRQLSDRELKLEYLAAMCSCRYDDATAILGETARREEAGKAVFEPVTDR